MQTRSHNDDNQLTGVVQGGNISAPTYDGAGNMTAHPDIGTTSAKYDLTYDAWNRLVKVTEPGSPGVDVGQYEYDGLHRRVVKKYGSGLSATRYFLYSANWQVLEERLTASGNPDKRYAWGVRYLDDPVLRLGMPSADDPICALHDYYNVTALVEEDQTEGWQAVQRYRYSAYGDATVMDAEWSGAADAYDWAHTYAAYYQDVADSADTGFYQCRYRYYSSLLGRWLTRDPIPTEIFENLYEYVISDPINRVDFYGLQAQLPGWPTPEFCS